MEFRDCVRVSWKQQCGYQWRDVVEYYDSPADYRRSLRFTTSHPRSASRVACMRLPDGRYVELGPTFTDIIKTAEPSVDTAAASSGDQTNAWSGAYPDRT